MRTGNSNAAAVLLGTIPANGQVAERSRGDVTSPDAELEPLADVGIRTKGPVAAPDGSVYFVDLDIPSGGRIWRWDPVRREALALDESEAVSSYHVALVFLGIGEHDAFFEWLERARRERSTWMVWFHVSPSLHAVREDPRFREMARRMRLPEAVEPTL